MKPFDFPLLADENIHPSLVQSLKEAGFNITSIAEIGKFGLPDEDVLKEATKEERVVLTHDSDFGRMAFFGADFVGIIYLRPGHILPAFTLETINAITKRNLEVEPPFILVAERGEKNKVKIRLRQF